MERNILSEQTDIKPKEYKTWFDVLDELFKNNIWKKVTEEGANIIITKSVAKKTYTIWAMQNYNMSFDEMIKRFDNINKKYKHEGADEGSDEGIKP